MLRIPFRTILVAGLLALPLFLSAADQRIVVLKGERLLKLYADGKVVKTYRVGLGPHPTGSKLRQGDGRTPEGTFYVCVKNEHSQYYRSLGLSYPTPADAARGLRDGLITQAQHDTILAAHKKHATPPWNTPLGGEIFIHGNGSSSDWTLGCIALEDADMKELFATVAKGTAVEIRP
jgi:murein L,D-transpeptidase YafK